MKLNRQITPILQRKLATLVLLSASMVAFATLGEGGKKSEFPRSKQNLLSARTGTVNYKSFTLRSGYSYRGSKVLSQTESNNYIILNQPVMVERGNQAYILPIKRKVLLDKVSFKPTRY